MIGFMRGLFGVLATCAALCAAGPSAAENLSPLALWYDHPAADWEREGLPIGNGAMGAVIMGGVETDRLQFNEKTLWTGGPGSAEGFDAGLPPGSIADEVHRLQGDLNRAGRLAPEAVAARLGRPMRGYGNYQTFGDLVLDLPNGGRETHAYRRELDIARALARVSYEAGGVHFTREYFASYPDGVIVVRLTADRPRQLNFRVHFDIPDNRSRDIRARNGRITARGALSDNGERYEAQVQVVAEGGVVRAADAAVSVENANAATLILSAGTNYAARPPAYRGADPHAALQRRVDRAAAKTYARLMADHETDYRRLFDRVTLDIGQIAPGLPADQWRARYGSEDAAADRALEALYFQYGRYLLIASSRAGSLPANLQGVWNHVNEPPWNADYHVNINLQMNYWLAETGNLQETTPPLFTFIDSLVPNGRLTARRLFDADGWTLSLNTDAWGFTGLIAWPTAFWQPEGGAWIAQHLFEHYRFTRDETFLRQRAWPVMKGAAELWLAALVTDPRDGKLVVSPSYSPEHGDFSVGASMSQQIVFDLFTNVSEAARIVGDAAFGARVDAALRRLDPGLRIGAWGQLQEWKEDWDNPHDDHRHVSHLFALHPGRQISPSTTPIFANAARVSLTARGDGGTGWSKAWKINFWARLRDGDHAHLMLAQQLRDSTLPNLWDTHPPFQIDGNFGASAGVIEMLVQSQLGEIDILPALPGAWQTGSVAGLRARGDVVVDINWSAGRAREVLLHAGHPGAFTLCSTLLSGRFEFKDRAGRPVSLVSNGICGVFFAEAGMIYRLRQTP